MLHMEKQRFGFKRKMYRTLFLEFSTQKKREKMTVKIKDKTDR